MTVDILFISYTSLLNPADLQQWAVTNLYENISKNSGQQPTDTLAAPLKQPHYQSLVRFPAWPQTWLKTVVLDGGSGNSRDHKHGDCLVRGGFTPDRQYRLYSFPSSKYHHYVYLQFTANMPPSLSALQSKKS